MSDKPLWVRWFPADFRGSGRVGRMSRDEEFLYRVLLDYQATDGALPSDPSSLARIAKMTPEEFRVAWGAIRDCFVQGEDGQWRNPRMHHERERVFNAREEAAANGRRGASKRWGGHSDPIGVATGDPNGGMMTSRESGVGSREPGTKKREEEAPAAAPPPVADAPVSKARKPRVEPTGNHADLARWWTEAWKDARGTEWAWSPKDFAALKAIRTLAKEDTAEIKRRGERMLAHRDRWIVENASPTTLRSKWNELGVEVTPVNGHHHNGRGQRVLIEDLVASGEIRIRGVNDHD